MMTRKDYVQTSNILKGFADDIHPQVFEDLVEELQEQIQEQIDLEYIAENTIELSIPTSLENIPGITEIFAATEAILNVGSDMTQEQREESQSVVIASIVLTQIAQISAVAATTQRTRK